MWRNSFIIVFHNLTRSVLSNMIAQVSVWTESSDLNQDLWVPTTLGLHLTYLRAKWSRTRSRSWVSPAKQNRVKNWRNAASRPHPSKVKNLRYSSATTWNKQFCFNLILSYFTFSKRISKLKFKLRLIYEIWLHRSTNPLSNV